MHVLAMTHFVILLEQLSVSVSVSVKFWMVESRGYFQTALESNIKGEWGLLSRIFLSFLTPALLND